MDAGSGTVAKIAPTSLELAGEVKSLVMAERFVPGVKLTASGISPRKATAPGLSALLSDARDGEVREDRFPSENAVPAEAPASSSDADYPDPIGSSHLPGRPEGTTIATFGAQGRMRTPEAQCQGRGESLRPYMQAPLAAPAGRP
jgi:hypothetical protein